MNYKWYLKNNYKDVENNGLNVFGSFICGGGSTMGYKLAGYNHLGGIEIDPKVADVYKANHNPKHLYVMDVRKFLDQKDLPKELFDLDIFDGSPPCSSFSMAGSREKKWGEEKVFREGQAKQVLDDLFFEYIKIVDMLKPKVFIAENVKGMLMGNAKSYVKKIKREIESIGYNVQLFLLNSATMGVPQKRERVFFIGYRKELNFPKLNMNFNEKPITFGEVEKNMPNIIGKEAKNTSLELWNRCLPGKSFSTVHPKGSYFNSIKVHDKKVMPTICASKGGMYHYSKPNEVHDSHLKMCGSYPLDFNFKSIDAKYLIGMSVPPLMTARISKEVARQWLEK